MTYEDAKEYAEDRQNSLTGSFGDVVEVEFFDAHMEIKWAFVEVKDDTVFVFSEHYPPIFQHVDETVRFRQTDFDGNEIKSWENEDR